VALVASGVGWGVVGGGRGECIAKMLGL